MKGDILTQPNTETPDTLKTRTHLASVNHEQGIGQQRGMQLPHSCIQPPQDSFLFRHAMRIQFRSYRRGTAALLFPAFCDPPVVFHPVREIGTKFGARM